MAFNGTQQIIIDSTTKEVKRHGMGDMENDSAFDSGSETLISNDFKFDPSLDEAAWTWNGSTFIEGAAVISQTSNIIQQIDVNKSAKNSTYRTLSRIIYLGSKLIGDIKTMEIIGYMDVGVTSYDVRLVDKGNQSAVLAEKTGLTNTEDAIIDMGAISNLSTTKTRIDIQVRVTDGNNSNQAYLDSILIKY